MEKSITIRGRVVARLVFCSITRLMALVSLDILLKMGCTFANIF